jgi:twitching motility protein PilT
MPPKQSIPLVGRLAIQLKLLTPKQVERAMAESVSSGNPRLAQVFLQLGMLDREQILKLQKTQRSLVEKHRARSRGAPPEGAVLGRVRTGPAPGAPASASARESRDAEAIHRVAAHAAEMAAPMRVRDVDDLYAAPSGPREAATESPAERSSRPAPAATPPAAADRIDAPAPPLPPAVASASEPMAASTSEPMAASAVDAQGVSLDLHVPDAGAEDRSRLESMLTAGVSQGASDIHLHAGGPLKLRVHGRLVVADDAVASDAVERMVAAATTPEQRAVLARDGEIDFCFDLPGVGRFRANAYRQQRGLDAVFRSLSDTPPTLESLGLPADLKRYTDYHQGMVLVTGPTGCGKSSTMAALVNHINETRDEHILTVEDPIEVIHPSKRCLVNQRHAGRHTASFSRALRGALREDPDIIVIGELRDLETISLAMTAAETGHFVLASLHTANAVRTVNRMIGAFPSNEQDQVRAMLSESLKAVISQRLVPTSDGQGRVPALELLVINRAIGNLIRDEKTVQIRSSMQTGRAHGMYLLEQSLNDLVAAGKITRDLALELAEEEKLITAGA